MNTKIDGIPAEETGDRSRKITGRDVRERVKSYGKWYLEPKNFTMKNEINTRKVLKIDAGEEILPEDEEEMMLFKDKRKKIMMMMKDV